MRLIIIEKGAIDPANVDAPTVDTETIHNFEGLQQTKRGYREEGLIAQSELRITIIGGSLPDGVFPNVGNYIEIDNNRREILEIISADSTGAVYEVRVK